MDVLGKLGQLGCAMGSRKGHFCHGLCFGTDVFLASAMFRLEADFGALAWLRIISRCSYIIGN